VTAPIEPSLLLPFISVILPVRNEERFIAATLRRLAAQDYPRSRFEIIVIDGLSSDSTRDCVTAVAQSEPLLQLRLLSNLKKLSSAARNLGVAEARGDYVLIVDGHVDIPTATLLTDAAVIIREQGATILGRPQRLSASGLSRQQQIIAATRACRIGHAQDSHIYSLDEGWVPPGSIAVMYERSLFVRFGGFDESFDAAEDLEFNTRLERAGLRCYTSPKLEVLYFPRHSLKGLFAQMRRYGVGRTKLWRKNGSFPSVTAAAPALMVAAGALLALGALQSVMAVWALGLCALTYTALVAAVRRGDAQLKAYPLWRVLPTMLSIHVGLGVGILGGLFKAKSQGNSPIPGLNSDVRPDGM
jgi:cellulose synthase/poly-beta-1,6-N-acetylglucosamine synthase-like glycosyltransferase